MNYGFLRFIAILGLMILLAGCAGTPAVVTGTDTKQAMSPTTESTLVPSSTPDPCSTELIKADVQRVHEHMREFDDASILASNLPLQELSGPIANLQKPPCN